MTPGWVAALNGLADHLLRASVQGGIFVLAAWWLSRLVPELPARVRAWVWWLACARFLIGLAWVSPVALPVLPAAEVALDAPAGPRAGIAEMDVALLASREVTTAADAHAAGAVAAVPTGWRPWLAIAWTVLAGLVLLRTLTGAWHTARLLASAEAADARLAALASDAAARVGLRNAPTVLVSPRRVAPQVVWIGPPRVLLGRDHASTLDDDQLRMLLGHELSHVRRLDGWWAWVPALTHHLFAFHPLARFAGREYALAREAACDAEVMARFDASGADYGRLLVRLGVASPRPTLATAGTPCSVAALKRRLIMLERWTPSARRLSARAALVIAVCLLAMVPVTLVRGAARDEATAAPRLDAPMHVAAPTQAPTHVDAAPAHAAAPRHTQDSSADEPDALDRDQIPPPPPPPPAPPAPPAPPPPPPAPPQMLDDLVVKGQRVESWSFVSGDGVSMHRNLRLSRHTSKGGQERAGFWFEYGGKSLVIDDPATLAAIQQAFAPIHETGRRQGAVGHDQATIGQKQAEIGARQAEVGAKQAALAARQAEAAARQMARAARTWQGTETSAAADQAMQDAERAIKEVEREMAALDERMRELGRQQEALGAQQEPLARRQEELAHDLESHSAQVRRDLTAVLEHALDAGLAKPVAK